MKKILISCTVVYLLSLFLWRMSYVTFDTWLYPVRSGIPTIFQRNTEYWSRMSTPVVATDRLYLLYDNLVIIKVYDLRGSYLYSINFPNNGHRGTSNLYAMGDELLFQIGGHSGFYYFKSDQFVGFYPDKTIKEIGVNLTTNCSDYRSEKDSNGNSYRIDGASIIREDPTGVETVFIRRASWLQLYQNNSFAVIMIVSFFAMAFIIKREQ